MKKVGIVTDSHSGISQELAKELGIYVLPMPFYFGDECYYEGINLTRDDFFSKINTNQTVTTSQPSPADVMQIWKEALKEYEEILYFPISSGLSSSCATATALALDDEFSGRVYVVDNGRVATPMHRSVLDALEMVEDGLSAKEIKEILEKTKDTMSIYIMVDTLEYLKRGGRITAASASIGTLLNIKPVLCLKTGKLDVIKKSRGVKKAKKIAIEAMKHDLETIFKQYYDKGEVHLLAASSASKEDAAAWVEEIKEEFPGMDVMYDDLSLGLCCHIGPNGFGIGCSCYPKKTN
ncbi:MAG: DegV family protein [Lachnospiraceae bacterium]